LAEQAKILFAEAEENNLGDKVQNERWQRWNRCGLCEQQYHGVVWCALGWACWKTYLGRPEEDRIRRLAMNVLGSGLSDADHHEDALSVKEAELATYRRLGAPEEQMLAVQSNLSDTYQKIGRLEEALQMKRDVYSGWLRLNEEHENTLIAANNFAALLHKIDRFEEAKALMSKTIPVARRVLGEGNRITLAMRWMYAQTLYLDDAATLHDLREAVTTLEDLERIARRVLGGAHPFTGKFESVLRDARAALAAREGDVESVSEAVAAMAPGDA